MLSVIELSVFMLSVVEPFLEIGGVRWSLKQPGDQIKKPLRGLPPPLKNSAKF